MKLYDILFESKQADQVLLKLGYPESVVDYLKTQFGEKYYLWVGKSLAAEDQNTQGFLEDAKDNPAELALSQFRSMFETDMVRFSLNKIKDLISKATQRVGGANFSDHTIQSLHDLIEAEAVPPDTDFEVKMTFPDGFKWVDLKVTESKYEAARMKHCGICSTGGATIWSLRDKKNIPHATIDVTKNGLIKQAKGYDNQIPTKYRRYLIELCKQPFIHGLETMTEGRKKLRDFSIVNLSDDEIAEIQRVNPSFVISQKDLGNRANKLELIRLNPVIKKMNEDFNKIQIPELQRQLENIVTELSIQYPAFDKILIPKEGRFAFEMQISPTGIYPTDFNNQIDKTFEYPEYASIRMAVLFVYVLDHSLGEQGVEAKYENTGVILDEYGQQIISDKVTGAINNAGLMVGKMDVDKITEFLHAVGSDPDIDNLPKLPPRSHYSVEGFRVSFITKPRT